VALALFLPAHFYVMGLALGGEAALDGFLRWSAQPLVIAAEWVLVMLLAAHLAGGLRLLALELLPWRSWQKTLAAAAGAFAVACGLVFALAR
jgi:fumarate reductase subunit D